MPSRASFPDDMAAGIAAWQKAGEHRFVFPWPLPGNPGALIEFETFEQWREKVSELGLAEGVPLIVSAKFNRAQRLMLLAWIDADLAKAAELVALTALELALTDANGRDALPWAIEKGLAKKPKKKKKIGDKIDKAPFAALLKYMVKKDGLTDEKVAINVRCQGGTVIGLLTGKTKPSLADIRNAAAHGDPFDGLPRSGLVELCRDLIEYAYRDRITPSA